MYFYDYTAIKTVCKIDTTLGSKIQNSNNARQIFFQHLEQSDALSIDTDGSKTRYGVGAACFSPDTDTYIKKR